MGLDLLFQKTHPKKIKPGDAFENSALSVDLKLSNSKLGRRDAALHLFVKQTTPIDS
jgi:hypothetical protein